MATRIEQPAIIMLTVQLNKRFRQIAQHFTADTAIIDPRRLTSIARVDTAQNHFAIFNLNTRFFQNDTTRMACRQIKRRRYLALFGTRTYQFGTATPAQNKSETIQENRFSRTGFASQHIKTRLERQFQPINNEHVTDIYVAKHVCVGWVLTHLPITTTHRAGPDGKSKLASYHRPFSLQVPALSAAHSYHHTIP